jgi:L-asparaginase II
MSPPATAVLAEVTRHDGTAERVESRHRGQLVLVGPDGPELALGDGGTEVFVRSAVKPFQATACLELLAEGGPVAPDDLTDPEVAVAWSSHRGERRHLDAVGRLLARSGTAPAGLTCPPAMPEADRTWPPTSPGEPPSRIRHNCSGKHALFALAGKGLGLRGAALLDPDGPLQQRVVAGIRDACGPVVGIGVDGCGAPAVVVPLHGLAAGFRRLASEHRWARVREAGCAHPGLVGGDGRVESALLRAGVVAKVGAEGVYGAGWVDEDGAHGIAVKSEDGETRGAAVALVAALAARGVVADDVWRPPAVTGGDRVVGRVRAAAAVTG